MDDINLVCAQIAQQGLEDASNDECLYPLDGIEYIAPAALRYIKQNNCKEEFVQGIKDLIHHTSIKNDPNAENKLHENALKRLKYMPEYIKDKDTVEYLKEVSVLPLNDFLNKADLEFLDNFRSLNLDSEITLFDYYIMFYLMSNGLLLEGSDGFVSADEAYDMYYGSSNSFKELKQYLGIDKLGREEIPE